MSDRREEEMETLCYVAPRAMNELPSEVFQYCLRFSTSQEVCRAQRVCHTFEASSRDADLWLDLLDRDFGSRGASAVAKYPEHRPQDVYQMVRTGRYVEKHFEDRPFVQKVGIVVGSVVLLPLLLLYLFPSIVIGIYENAVVPTLDAWKAEEQPRSLDVRVYSHYQHRPLGPSPTKRRCIPFARQPLYMKAIIIVVSVVFSPYIIVKHWGTARKMLRKLAGGGSGKLGKLIKERIVAPIKRTVFLAWRAVRAVAAFLREDIVFPIGRFLRSTASIVWEDAAKPTGRAIATTAQKTAVLTRRAAKSTIAFCWNDVLRPIGRQTCLAAHFAVRVAKCAQAAACRNAVASAGWTQSHVLLPLKRIVCETAKKAWDCTTQCAKLVWDRILCPTGRGIRAVVKAVAKAVRWTIRTVARIITVCAKFVWDRILCPTGRGIRATVKAVVGAVRWTIRTVARIITVCAKFVWDRILCPTGRGIRAAVKAVVGAVRWTIRTVIRIITVCAKFVWDRILCPTGRGIRAAVKAVVGAVRWTIRTVARIITVCAKFVWDRILCPTGRGIRAAVKAVVGAVRWTIRTVIRIITVCAKFVWDRILCPTGRGIRATVKAVVGAVRWTIRTVIRIITVCAKFVWDRILCPVGRSIRKAARCCRMAVVYCIAAFAYVLYLLGRWTIRAVSRTTTLCSRFVWDRILCPTGRGIRATVKAVVSALRRTIRFVARATTLCSRFVWDRILCPVGRLVQKVARICRMAVAMCILAVVRTLNLLVRRLLSLLRATFSVLRNAMRAVARFLWESVLYPLGRTARQTSMLVFRNLQSLALAAKKMTAAILKYMSSTFYQTVWLPALNGVAVCKRSSVSAFAAMRNGVSVVIREGRAGLLLFSAQVRSACTVCAEVWRNIVVRQKKR